MRIYLTCMTCLSESGEPAGLVAAHLEDSGLYRMTCERGHETVTCLQQMKFEVLFDLGAYAIIDGYYREAVSSFASALERFYEFYIQIQCDRRSIEAPLFEAAWKHVSSQSERQLGAFIFMYLTEKKTKPPVLAPRAVELRNSVVHKGKIPSRDEAIWFGEQVSGIVVPVLSDVRGYAEEDVQRAVGRHMAQLNREVSGSKVAVMCAGTMISISRALSEPQPTVREWISMLEEQRARMTLAVKYLEPAGTP